MDAVAVVNAEMETEALLKGRDCSAPLGNLNRFSETFFFKEDRSQDVCTIEIAVDVVAVVAVAVGVVVGGDFSTLPWLSLRNGGGSHFLPLKPRLLLPGEFVFAAPLPSFAAAAAAAVPTIIFSVSSGNIELGGTF